MLITHMLQCSPRTARQHTPTEIRLITIVWTLLQMSRQLSAPAFNHTLAGPGREHPRDARASMLLDAAY